MKNYYTGGRRRFGGEGETFVDLTPIQSPLETNTVYVIYRVYPENISGYLASDAYLRFDKPRLVGKIKEITETLNSLDSRQEIDQLVYDQLKHFGDIQVVHSAAGRSNDAEYFDLVLKGSCVNILSGTVAREPAEYPCIADRPAPTTACMIL